MGIIGYIKARAIKQSDAGFYIGGNMKSTEFCYWLQGFFEISGGANSLTKEQSEMIQKHLHLVFKHEIDPSYPDAEKLNKIHNPDPKANPNSHLTHRPDPGEPIVRC